MGSRQSRRAWVIALLASLACGCRSAGPFDRGRFEDVVARVRLVVTAPDRTYLFRLDGHLDPATLAPLGAGAAVGRGDGRGLVRATVDSKHHLAVSIETRDDGHAGEYGYMFADDGFDEKGRELVERDSQREERVDDRWVSWFYNLD